MNKQQYMDELVRKLEAFGDEIKDEIVSDYEEHFRMGLANGKTEDQICRELGNIDELVEELNKLTGNESTAEETSTEDFSKNITDAMTSFAGFLGGLAATIAKNTEKFASSFSENAGNAASKASEKAGEWGEKFSTKAGDWTVEFKAKAGETAEILRAKAGEFKNDFADRSEDTIDNLKAKADEFAGKSSEFAKKAANGIGEFAKEFAAQTKAFAKEVSDTYRQSMNQEASEAAADTDMEDEIDELAREIAGDEAETLREMDSLDGEPSEESDALSGSASEPADSVIIDTDCAHVYVNGCDAGENIKFNYENFGTVNQKLAYGFDFRQEGRTVYASVKKKPGTSNFFKSITSPEIELTIEVPEGLKNLAVRTMSGDVDCEDVAVDQLTVNTISGDIQMSNCIEKALEASTMSGDIELTDTSASSMQITAVSGDFNITNGTVQSMNAKTTSGDVNIEDCTSSDITAGSISGDVRVSLNKADGYLAHVKTTCGDISLEYNGESLDVIRGGSYVLGNGEVKLNLSTVSGDIEVDG